MLCFSVSSMSQKILDTVVVTASRKGIRKLTTTSNTSVVSSKELLKAACCNLAESFETNPSIDVNFSDAISGTKQIKMLGLTSPYILITEENIPSIRGASQAYGMSFTPGTWVESIQITKGAGSVVNGYESISGQINTELIKPIKDIPFFLNVYGASDSRTEINTHFNQKLSNQWSTSLFLHGNSRWFKYDMNHDGYLDNPLAKQVNLTSRWQYVNPQTGWVSFINIKWLNDAKQAGQVDFNPERDKFSTSYWGSEIKTNRIDVTSKVGYVFKDMPYQSIGFQNAFSNHDQESYFGLRQYNIVQQSFYSNLIFNSIISNTNHKFATGVTFSSDRYLENFNQEDLGRRDTDIGAYFEYTFDNQEKWSFVLGGRVDSHNRLGFFATPRLHVRYKPWEKGTFRFSAGRGKRAANIYAENQNLFGSSRQFSVLDASGKIYGLNPEIAWNYGLSFTQSFRLFNKPADVTLDVYRTDFQNQVVVDIMQSPQEVLFYNLKGSSYANSVQFDFNYEIRTRLQLRTAYKYYDVRTSYLSGNFQRPLQAKQRFFVNVEYDTPLTKKGKQWKFDFTYNWLGSQQLPNTASNPVNDRLSENSPAFSVINAQITKRFSKSFEFYLGGENIGNYRQNQAILGANNPFGSTFDTSIVYGPIFGKMYYAGLRYKLK
ncbi:outer membrane receptor for ferrienterochelin and colicin [Flavobacterium aciduliphilum]|uniref:Outer membrane receptor for ferrienterochelin and colicin n=2 Tax=Flavobacterium aciduliphilum TaxID=1101402 RepID=A0A328YEI1_9FLAO|nr:outer membrane receptor for ferrienterochelin and colicin [Flavobacterium aciduliphilum]